MHPAAVASHLRSWRLLALQWWHGWLRYFSLHGEWHNTRRLDERNYLATLQRKRKQARLQKQPQRHIAFLPGETVSSYAPWKDHGQAYCKFIFIPFHCKIRYQQSATSRFQKHKFSKCQQKLIIIKQSVRIITNYCWIIIVAERRAHNLVLRTLISSDLVILLRLPKVNWPQSENIRSTLGLGSWSSHQVFTKIRWLIVAGKLASPKCQTIFNMFLADVGEVVLQLWEDGILVTS